MAARTKMAVIFDFDDTLTDDSTAALLKANGIDPQDFYKKEVNRLVVDEGWDPAPAYLHLILEAINNGHSRHIKQGTNSDLKKFGATLKPYPGLRTCLKDLRKIADEHGHEVDFYIISSGIQDIIDGFQLRGEFRAAWGCRLAPAQPGGKVRHVKRVVTFTEKTRYLFEINKGISPEDAAKNPYLVNEAKTERPVPFANMIYLGDGLTDVPCMSLIEKGPTGPGESLAVFHPESEKSAKDAWVSLLAPRRVKGIGDYRYGPKQVLGALLRALFRVQCARAQTRQAA